MGNGWDFDGMVVTLVHHHSHGVTKSTLITDLTRLCW